MSDLGSSPSSVATLLLIEPDTGRATMRSSVLEMADYAVIPARSTRDVQALKAKLISIVIVCEHFERSRLREVTECARRKWPFARILILGQVQRILEDHLYDDAIEEPVTPKRLLETLRLMLLHPRCQRSEPGQVCRVEAEVVALPSRPHLTTPSESDPTKMIPPGIVSQTATWDTPSGERAGK